MELVVREMLVLVILTVAVAAPELIRNVVS